MTTEIDHPEPAKEFKAYITAGYHNIVDKISDDGAIISFITCNTFRMMKILGIDPEDDDVFIHWADAFVDSADLYKELLTEESIKAMTKIHNDETKFRIKCLEHRSTIMMNEKFNNQNQKNKITAGGCCIVA